MQFSRPIHVIGAGAFGSALAHTWHRAGRDVTLWCRDTEQASMLAGTGQNTKVPGCPPLKGIKAGALADFESTGAGDCIVLALKAQVQSAVFAAIKPGLSEETAVVTASKGFANPSGDLLSESLDPAGGLSILSGPSFAQDLFENRPAALTLATEAADESLIHALSTPSFRLYASMDTVGVQICGAMKNVIAIACGCSDGMGFGASARTALMTRGLREIERVIDAYGGDQKTAAGLAGVGDLALTCQDRQSRNFSFGFELGQGHTAADLLQNGTTVEGATAAGYLRGSARVASLDLPISTAVADLVEGAESPAKIVEKLLTRRLAADV